MILSVLIWLIAAECQGIINDMIIWPYKVFIFKNTQLFYK